MIKMYLRLNHYILKTNRNAFYIVILQPLYLVFFHMIISGSSEHMLLHTVNLPLSFGDLGLVSWGVLANLKRCNHDSKPDSILLTS